MLVVRLIVWLTPSWLWRSRSNWNFLIVWLNPSMVDRQVRENARAMKGGRSELEEELVAWGKHCIDRILHPQADK